MRRRLPPKGTPERFIHEQLLKARRSGMRALDHLRRVELNDDMRDALLEQAFEIRRLLEEIDVELSR